MEELVTMLGHFVAQWPVMAALLAMFVIGKYWQKLNTTVNGHDEYIKLHTRLSDETLRRIDKIESYIVNHENDARIREHAITKLSDADAKLTEAIIELRTISKGLVKEMERFRDERNLGWPA